MRDCALRLHTLLPGHHAAQARVEHALFGRAMAYLLRLEIAKRDQPMAAFVHVRHALVAELIESARVQRKDLVDLRDRVHFGPRVATCAAVRVWPQLGGTLLHRWDSTSPSGVCVRPPHKTHLSCSA